MFNKLKLETVIFTLAATQGKSIFSRHGKLISPRAVGFLAQIISLYNQCYERENKEFLCDDIRYEQQLESNFYKSYLSSFDND